MKKNESVFYLLPNVDLKNWNNLQVNELFIFGSRN